MNCPHENDKLCPVVALGINCCQNFLLEQPMNREGRQPCPYTCITDGNCLVTAYDGLCQCRIDEEKDKNLGINLSE